MLHSYTSLCGVITGVFLVCLRGTVVECMPLKREVSSSTPTEDLYMYVANLKTVLHYYIVSNYMTIYYNTSIYNY